MNEIEWTEADTEMLAAYFGAVYDWLDDHGYFWKLWDRPDDVDWICEAYDEGYAPDYAAVMLTRRWRRFTVIESFAGSLRGPPVS